jgi:hypothetical protein
MYKLVLTLLGILGGFIMFMNASFIECLSDVIIFIFQILLNIFLIVMRLIMWLFDFILRL